MRRVLKHALRQLRREWKAGEILALGLAVAIAVGAVTAVLGFSGRMVKGLERSAGEVIAADLKLTSRQTLSEALEKKALQNGLSVARTTVFPTVIFDEGQTLLTSVKAVSEGYPLRGALRLRRSLGEEGSDEVMVGVPAPGELWADARVYYALDLKIGDSLRLGKQEFLLTAVLVYEPDRGGQFFSFSPRLMINATDLERTDLLGPSSRARYALLAAGDADAVERMRDEIEAELDPRIALVDLESAQEQVGATVSTARDFIGLASLGTLLIAGLAIAVASRRYVDRRRRQTALLRTFGESGVDVIATHIAMLIGLGLVSGCVGALVGFGVQQIMAMLLSGLLPSALPSMSFAPAVLAIGLGTFLLVTFSTPALMSLSKIAPIEVLRRVEVVRMRRPLWLAYLLPVAALVGLAFYQVTSPILVVVLVGAIFAALAVMMAVSALVLAILRIGFRGAGVSWRFGLGRLIRNKVASTFQIGTIGLGLTILILLSVVRGQLFEAWEARTPEDAPNFFFANIQSHERQSVQSFFEDRFSESTAFTPMATGRLVAINGTAPRAEDYPDPRTASRIDGNLNFSWAASLPPGNTLLEGRWWDTDSSEPVVSLAARWAEPLRVGVGDRISVRVGAEVVEARIINIREVQWESFTPNFFVLFPPNILAEAPHTYLSALQLQEQEEKQLVDLNRQFPTVNIVDIGAILTQVRRVLDLVGMALNLVFGFTLAAGAAVLFSVTQANQESRMRDVAMLKVLGCDQRRIRAALHFEFLVIALIAGLLGGGAALLTGEWLAEWVFEIPYVTRFKELFFALPTSVIIVWLVSVLGVRKAQSVSPQTVLKDLAM